MHPPNRLKRVRSALGSGLWIFMTAYMTFVDNLKDFYYNRVYLDVENVNGSGLDHEINIVLVLIVHGTAARETKFPRLCAALTVLQ